MDMFDSFITQNNSSYPKVSTGGNLFRLFRLVLKRYEIAVNYQNRF